jgi:hypothetical protein
MKSPARTTNPVGQIKKASGASEQKLPWIDFPLLKNETV